MEEIVYRTSDEPKRGPNYPEMDKLVEACKMLPRIPWLLKKHGNPSERDLSAFLGQCLVHMDDSVAQTFQDIWALHETGFLKRGYFVDFGATDGKTISNSWLLSENYDWAGLCIEPNPFYHNQLTGNRYNHSVNIDNRCVWKESNLEIPFVVNHNNPDLSTIEGFENPIEGLDVYEGVNIKQPEKVLETIEVETVTLMDALKDNNSPPIIHFMSVDTEGTEFEILESFFNNPKSTEYYIQNVCIETNYEPKYRQAIHDLMLANNYEHKFSSLTYQDDFFRRKNIIQGDKND